MSGWLSRILLAILGFGVATAGIEIGLRLWGFHFDPTPIVQFGWPEPFQFGKRYRIDPDLFWVPLTYDELLNQARASHPAIAFLGDSCTEFGKYPQKTLEILTARQPALATGTVFAAGGWSSEQGRKQLERDVLPLRPRVVTVYFGWNDHWIALGPRDKDVSRIMAATRLSTRLRIVQLYLKLAFSTRRPKSKLPSRVSLERYRSNLEEIVRRSQEAGIKPVLITAPTLMHPGAVPVGLAKRFARSLDEVPALHEQYVDATRSVGEETGATLCDAAKIFHSLPDAATYFRADMVHFTEKGDQAIAELLSGCIEQAIGLPEKG
jgi:lysophospholipase L1-like esterase